MDTTIRNLDPVTYRAVKARAALTGRTIGDIVNEALRSWLGQPDERAKTGSFFDRPPEDFGPGTEHLSDEVDALVYGIRDV